MSKKRRVSLTPLRAGIQTTYQTSRRAPVQVGGGGDLLPGSLAGPFILSREKEREKSKVKGLGCDLCEGKYNIRQYFWGILNELNKEYGDWEQDNGGGFSGNGVGTQFEDFYVT